MKAKHRRVMPKASKDANSVIRLLESSVKRLEGELTRERRSTDRYTVCLHEQLDRTLAERDEFKRQYERAVDQLISLAGRAPISDEAVQAQPVNAQQVVDSAFASMFGEDEGNNLFPRVIIEELDKDEQVQ